MSSDAGKQEKGNIITSEGAVIGVKNKVRDGLAAFEGKEATQWVSKSSTERPSLQYTLSFLFGIEADGGKQDNSIHY